MNTHLFCISSLSKTGATGWIKERKERFNSCIYGVSNNTENTLLFSMLSCLSSPLSRDLKIVKWTQGSCYFSATMLPVCSLFLSSKAPPEGVSTALTLTDWSWYCEQLDGKYVSLFAFGCPKTLRNEEEERGYVAWSRPGPLPCLVIFFNLQSVGCSGLDLSANLSHWVSGVYVVKSSMKVGVSTYSFTSWATWQEGILGQPFCLDLPKNSLLASDLDYFISARSHYGPL